MRRGFFNAGLICLAACGFWGGRQALCAQVTERLYGGSGVPRIDTLRKGELALEVDNLSFFKNNEFISTVRKGYTLPGFWLQLKAVYHPFGNLKVEGGVHSIWFWGSSRYPASAYKEIAVWEGADFAQRVHVLPYFRAQIALSEHVDFVLGDIYGGSAHRLIGPLYDPELNLTSDPESGLQFLYRSGWLQLDMWVDWMTYIYRLDTKQEAFVAGASARFAANSPASRLHVYFLLQGLSQHRGGEIDVTGEGTQTMFNGAAGMGMVWNVGRRALRHVDAELDLAGYSFPQGCVYGLSKGRGFYARVAMQLSDFNVETSFWSCRDFMPIFGNAFYGSMSTKESDLVYENPQMLYLGGDYVYPLNKGFSFGIRAETYCYLSGKSYDLKTGLYRSSAFGSNTNYSVGVFLRINPSFLLKRY